MINRHVDYDISRGCEPDLYICPGLGMINCSIHATLVFKQTNMWCILCCVSHSLVYLVFLSGAGSGGQAQLTVGRTGRQQLSILQPLWQLPPLLLLPHRRDGRTQDEHPEEEKVRLRHSSVSQTHSDLVKQIFCDFFWFLKFWVCFFFTVVTFCWSWWTRREIMLETLAWWWR